LISLIRFNELQKIEKIKSENMKNNFILRFLASFNMKKYAAFEKLSNGLIVSKRRQSILYKIRDITHTKLSLCLRNLITLNQNDKNKENLLKGILTKRITVAQNTKVLNTINYLRNLVFISK